MRSWVSAVDEFEPAGLRRRTTSLQGCSEMVPLYRYATHGSWRALSFRHILLALMCVEVLFTVPGPFFAWWLPKHTDIAGELRSKGSLRHHWQQKQ